MEEDPYLKMRKKAQSYFETLAALKTNPRAPKTLEVDVHATWLFLADLLAYFISKNEDPRNKS